MPLLVMRQPAGSLLDQPCRLAVARQIQYGAERGVPWGVSESAYNVRDLELTYQYSDFGVPGLGIKRGLFEDLVVAPYATALAAMLDPARRRSTTSARLGGRGARGRLRVLRGARLHAVAPARGTCRWPWCAPTWRHHQGMTSSPSATWSTTARRAARFHAHPLVQAAELLLQERTPRAVAVTRPRGEELHGGAARRAISCFRRCASSTRRTMSRPRTHLLSNGRYTVMFTAAGSGYSRWRDLAVTRWREDATRDVAGARSSSCATSRSGAGWSAGFQPTRRRSRTTTRSSYLRGPRRDHARDRSLADHARDRGLPRGRRRVPPAHGDEPRDRGARDRLHVLRRDRAGAAGRRRGAPRVLEPLRRDRVRARARGAARDAPPARRRTRPRVWLAHVVGGRGRDAGRPVQYETDRARFLGRGRGSRATPLSVIDGGPLSDTAGAVLDPIVSLRRRRPIPRGRDRAHRLHDARGAVARRGARRSRRSTAQPATFERESSLAWTQAQVQLHHLGISQDEAHLFQRLANRLLYADPSLRAAPQVLARTRRGAPGSGPTASRATSRSPSCASRRGRGARVVRQLLRAHEYWRHEGDRRRSRDPERARRRPTRSALQESPWRHWCGRARRRRRERREQRAPCSCSGPIACSPRDRRAASGGGARSCCSRSAERSRSRSCGIEGARPGPVPRRPRAAAPRRAEPPRAARARSRVLERPRRVRGGGREYVTVLGKGQWTPAPVDQRRREPAVRLPGVRVGRRIHLVREQPREQAHAVDERPGERHARRDVLRAGRGRRARLWGRRSFRFAKSAGPTWSGTARATAASSTRRTASRSTSCSSFRCAIR